MKPNNNYNSTISLPKLALEVSTKEDNVIIFEAIKSRCNKLKETPKLFKIIMDLEEKELREEIGRICPPNTNTNLVDDYIFTFLEYIIDLGVKEFGEKNKFIKKFIKTIIGEKNEEDMIIKNTKAYDKVKTMNGLFGSHLTYEMLQNIKIKNESSSLNVFLRFKEIRNLHQILKKCDIEFH